MVGYNQAAEQTMLRFYTGLPEKERRYYAAQEVEKLIVLKSRPLCMQMLSVSIFNLLLRYYFL